LKHNSFCFIVCEISKRSILTTRLLAYEFRKPLREACSVAIIMTGLSFQTDVFTMVFRRIS